MNVRIEQDWMRGDFYKVWMYEPVGLHEYAMVLGVGEDGHLLMQNFKSGEAHPDPSFILPGRALKALVEVASDVLPPSDATVEALKDTREVRDRLLAMVERAVQLP